MKVTTEDGYFVLDGVESTTEWETFAAGVASDLKTLDACYAMEGHPNSCRTLVLIL